MSDFIKETESESLKIIAEPLGIYPMKNGQALGGILARDMTKVLDQPDIRWMGVMSFLAEEPATHEPYFFRFMNAEDRKNPEQWLKEKILDPLSKIFSESYFDHAATLEMHSQNLMIAVDERTDTLPKKFAYRDLGGWFFDFKQLATDRRNPNFNLIQPFDDVFAFKYSRSQPVHTVQRFLKLQMTDLFAIQMKSYGLIDAEQRELIKANMDKLWKGIFVTKLNEQNPKLGLTVNATWVELLDLWEVSWAKKVLENGWFRTEKLQVYRNVNPGKIIMYEGHEQSEISRVLVNKGASTATHYLLNAEGQIVGSYIPKSCSKNLKVKKRNVNEPEAAGQRTIGPVPAKRVADSSS